MLIARFILGALAAAAVWLAGWSFEGGDLDAMVLAALFTIAVSSFGSWLSLRSNRRKKLAPFVFAAPFAILALVCTPSMLDGIYRPFAFWSICSFAAAILSVFSDELVFRKIIDEEENS